jgi:hypothetical protein
MSQSEEKEELLSVEKYLERADARFFWDYILPRVLKLLLFLLYEHTDKPVGLIFPLQPLRTLPAQVDVGQLSTFGASLMGWLKENQTFYAFFTPAPFFDYADDYRLLPFDIQSEDTVIFVIPRRVRLSPLSSSPHQTTSRRILNWLRRQASTPTFMAHMANIRQNSVVAPLPAHAYDDPFPNTIFNNLAEMIVQLGGETPQGLPRWRFSCILIPKDDEGVLPLNQRTLLVYAQSTRSPHHVGQTLVFPHDSSLSISLRAFLSGHVLYRPQVTKEDDTIRFREVEGNVNSVFAMALNDEQSLPRAVLYISSDEYEAFSEEDQRIIRLMGRLVEEAFTLYAAYQRNHARLSDIMTDPHIIDPFFKDFLSENNFLRDVNEHFIAARAIQQQMAEMRATQTEEPASTVQQDERRFSLVIIDLNNQSKLTAIYGYQAVRNLSHGIGSRFYGLLNAHFNRRIPLYHLYGSRFCCLLDGDADRSVQSPIINIWNELQDPYSVSLQRSFIAQPSVFGSVLSFNAIQIRAAIISYSYQALQTFFVNPTDELTVPATMLRQMERGLKEGENTGGSILLSWTSESQQFEVIRSSSDSEK